MEMDTSRAASWLVRRTQVILPQFLADFLQWTMEMRLALPGTPDSPYIITVLGGNKPMDNGEHLLTQVSPETRPTLLLTMTGLGEWAMQNGGKGTPAAPWARDASEMTN